MRFTKPAISALTLSEGVADTIVFDDALPGFGVRLRGGGKRTWIVQYRVGTRQRRLTLGSLAVLDLDKARQAAKIALAKVGLALDPQAEKSQARLDAAATLGPLIKRYLAAKAKVLKPRSYVETERHLMKGWAPLHDQPIGAIHRLDLSNRLGALVKDSGPVSADRARAALSGFFSWAMREGLAESNPVIATNRPAEVKSRDRVLTTAELAEIWNACREDNFGRIVRLLMLTGQRREEVGAMQWSEISLGSALWSLPGSRTKNSRAHAVPLSDPALAILKGISVREGREFVFGEGQGGFSGWSKSKAALDRRILASRTEAARSGVKVKPVTPWRLHDLRRTAATGMADLGTSPHVIETVLNHVSGSKAGIAGVYNRAMHLPERRTALALWAGHVVAVVESRETTVVVMRRP